MPRWSSLVDRPTSRLSKRITRNPAPATRSHSLSGQKVDCTPSPMIISITGSPGSPRSSYASSRPLADTFIGYHIERYGPPSHRRLRPPALPRRVAQLPAGEIGAVSGAVGGQLDHVRRRARLHDPGDEPRHAARPAVAARQALRGRARRPVAAGWGRHVPEELRRDAHEPPLVGRRG